MSAECSQTFDEVRDLARSAPKRCAERRNAVPHAGVQTSVAQPAADAQPAENNQPGRRLVTIGVLLVALAAAVTFLGWWAQGEARDASSRRVRGDFGGAGPNHCQRPGGFFRVLLTFCA